MQEDKKCTFLSGKTRRQVVVAAMGGAAVTLVPGCGDNASNGASIIVRRPGRFFNEHQFRILKEVVDLMIPRTATPGAIDAGVHDFVDQMMIDWASASTQNSFRVALKRYDLAAEESFNTDFLSLTPEQKRMIAEKVDLQGFETRDRNYRKFKRLVYLGYETSEAANPDYMVVPGQYRGCVSVSEYQELVG